jgi:hypothetical protein
MNLPKLLTLFTKKMFDGMGLTLLRLVAVLLCQYCENMLNPKLDLVNKNGAVPFPFKLCLIRSGDAPFLFGHSSHTSLSGKCGASARIS